MDDNSETEKMKTASVLQTQKFKLKNFNIFLCYLKELNGWIKNMIKAISRKP